MKVRKWLCAGIFCATFLVAALYVHNYTVTFAEGHKMSAFAIELTKGDQLKQIVLSVLIYVYGYIVVKSLNLGRSEWWTATLAYPAGILCWCTLSSVVLIIGIPYRLSIMFVMLILFLGLCVYKMQEERIPIECSSLFRNLLYVLGIVAIVSSGLFWAYLSNDSVYYLVKYGEILALDGGFTENVSYWLTWIGFTPACISSLARFWGMYSIYTIHHMLMVSFVVFFIVSIYESVEIVFKKRQAIVIAAITVIALLLTPAFFLLGQWVISNTYFMIYMYIFMYVIYEIHMGKINVRGAYVFLSMILVFLTLSRAESMVTTCFLIICASTLKIEKKQMMGYLLMPSVCMQLAYWLRVYLVQGHLLEGMLSLKSIVVIVAAMVGTLVYLLLVREWLESKIGTVLPHLMLFALLGMNVVLFVLNTTKGTRNLKYFLHNIANEYWGFFPWLVLFFYLIFWGTSAKLNYWDLNWIGFILFNFGICLGGPGGVRQGIGDSLNRLICSIVPIIWFAIVTHIKEDLR